MNFMQFAKMPITEPHIKVQTNFLLSACKPVAQIMDEILENNTYVVWQANRKMFSML